jgi:hypothetical protein
MGVFHVTNVFSRAVDFSPGVQTKTGTNWVALDGVSWPAAFSLAAHEATNFSHVVPSGQTWRMAILYEKAPTALDEFTFRLRTLCFRFHLRAIGKRIPTAKWMFRESYSQEISEVDF